MGEQKAYQHKVQYYETDQMGIVHHSNYIRWFEEARTDYMERLGIGYEKMEEQGTVIMTCGTCLDYYGIKDKLAVGTVTNMYSIVETLQNAGKVIRP